MRGHKAEGHKAQLVDLSLVVNKAPEHRALLIDGNGRLVVNETPEHRALLVVC